jgi:tetratricopeptide (TPR) repeat protein
MTRNQPQSSIHMSHELSQRPVLEDFYLRFLKTEQSAEFIDQVSRHYVLDSLERLARSGRRMSRRAAVLAIGFLGDYSNNETLGLGLADADRGVRLLADHGIRQLWQRIGNPGLEAGLRSIIRLIRQSRHGLAMDLADELLDQAPDFAEAWNQRAIAAWHLEDYRQAIADCRMAIQLNPWHFLAALGSANCHLEAGDVVEALEDYRLALSINPDLDTVRSQIGYLSRIVEGR